MVEQSKAVFWVNCEKCGKRLLQRKANGVFVFKFGKNQLHEPIVNIEVLGSIKMKCFRESCKHTNVINFFPSS